jgi:Ca2+-binding EF-hand superfamily protein
LNFTDQFASITQSIQTLMPLEFFHFVLSTLELINQRDLIEKFLVEIQKGGEALNTTGSLVNSTLELLNPIELFTSYFDHLDKNKDGKLSFEEISDIVASLEFFKYKKEDKKEMLSSIKTDSKKLLSLVQSLTLKENILELVNCIDFNVLEEFISQIFQIVRKFDRQHFDSFVGSIKETVKFFNEYQDVLKDILKPENNQYLSILLCVVTDGNFLTQTIFFFQELTSTIDLNLIIEVINDIISFISECELFNSENYAKLIENSKNSLKSLFDSCRDLYQKILKILSTAVDHCLSIVDLDFEEIKEAVLDALDRDGDGDIDLEDVKKILDKDANGIIDTKDILHALDQDGNGNLDINDVKKVLDKNGDGRLSLHDVKQVLDKNGDGKIQMSDFKVILDKINDGKVNFKDIYNGIKNLIKKNK